MLWGPILYKALVLALLNEGINSLLLLIWEINIQFGHKFLIAIINTNIIVPIVQTKVLGAL